MTTRDLIDRAIRQFEQVNPIAARAYRLQVQLAAFEEMGEILRAEHPEAAELVDLNVLLTRAALVEVTDGPPDTTG